MIVSVEVTVRDLRLLDVQMKGLVPVQGTQESVFVRVTSDSGAVGHGEASSWAVFSEQSATAMAAMISGLLGPAVVGLDEYHRTGVQEAMEAAVPGNQVAKAAVDMAVHDLVARDVGLPVCGLLGGRPFRVALSYSVSAPVPEDVRRVVEKRYDAGYRTFKLKVGALDPETDAARIGAMRAAAADAVIRLDYNCRATEGHLRRIMGPAEAAGVEFCEQPFAAHQLDRTERLRSWFALPIGFDEAVTTVESLDTVLRRGLCDVVSLKFGRVGGTRNLIDMARTAERYGVGVYCGSLNESRLGVAAAMHAFSAVGGLVGGSDFYFPYEILDDGDIIGGPVRDGADIVIGDGAGHGAAPPDHWFDTSRPDRRVDMVRRGR
ncbi:mandelate racemase/muconate lactonizing enzyme family protein [Streptosporangium algeriense]|uniref:Mandelate racemase/muconate lactonizing enzyme family protein n=1 Tax=Streptosporangium algeriense TaxID=1682748 RepID=A0ABW3DR42_9ACTN